MESQPDRLEEQTESKEQEPVLLCPSSKQFRNPEVEETGKKNESMSTDSNQQKNASYFSCDCFVMSLVLIQRRLLIQRHCVMSASKGVKSVLSCQIVVAIRNK